MDGCKEYVSNVLHQGWYLASAWNGVGWSSVELSCTERPCDVVSTLYMWAGRNVTHRSHRRPLVVSFTWGHLGRHTVDPTTEMRMTHPGTPSTCARVLPVDLP